MPAPKILSAQGAGKADLDIIPDSEFVVFHGNEHEAGEVELYGKVILNTPESLNFKTIKVSLEGRRKISWSINTVTGADITDKKTFYVEEKPLTLGPSSSGTHKLHRGQHAFPFKFSLTGAMPESIEGMDNSWIVYTLQARIERGVLFAKDLIASRHIRLVRTLGQDELETVQSRSNQDIWTNKISYNISLPSDAYIFGTSITADVELTPIRKGLRMGKIELQLLERSTLRIFANEMISSGQEPVHMNVHEMEVAKVQMDFPEDSLISIPNPDPNALMDEMYKFPLHLPLPRSLKRCRQNVRDPRIKIEHIWRLRVNLHNPEGHISQLVCKIPIKLFISPNLPINADQDVCPGPNQASEAFINQQETTLVAPPEYGAHRLDQLYNDIDPSGYRTPHPGAMSGSGGNTPPLGRSRSDSTENVTSLMHPIDDNTDGGNHGSGGGVSASAIHSRLSNLQEQGSVRWARSQTHHFSPHTPAALGPGADYFTQSGGRNSRHSPSPSQTVSPRPSDENANETGDSTDPMMSNLSRVPSYNTAVHTPRPENPVDTSLPTYEVATSRPPTPDLQRPGQAHFRGGHGSGSNLQEMTLVNDESEINAGVTSRTNLPDNRVPPPAHHQPGTDGDDEEARLRLLRAAN
ncbi:hypothetical protein EV356DRAFT_528167 [Viridothelium virens]|uniref:Arrestin C-terminal-like domain-containing protein n=1 Tax=Viridothelium virens TaxID=1048519 RepID=A0A6A6HN81_VIRVR|nr:hypothetical protein EV356DRAFT_528167 [Viridothelium virens]